MALNPGDVGAFRRAAFDASWPPEVDASGPYGEALAAERSQWVAWGSGTGYFDTGRLPAPDGDHESWDPVDQVEFDEHLTDAWDDLTGDRREFLRLLLSSDANEWDQALGAATQLVSLLAGDQADTVLEPVTEEIEAVSWLLLGADSGIDSSVATPASWRSADWSFLESAQPGRVRTARDLRGQLEVAALVRVGRTTPGRFGPDEPRPWESSQARAVRDAIRVLESEDGRGGLDVGAEERWRALAPTDPIAANTLGTRLRKKGDLEGAMAAFRFAAIGAYLPGFVNLGAAHEQLGDRFTAEHLYGHADRNGDAQAAHRLGVLFTGDGRGAEAEAAYVRADERGSREAADAMASILDDRGDITGAEDARRRAERRGFIPAFIRSRQLLGQGDHDGAESALAEADARGAPQAAYLRGILLKTSGRLDEAAAALRRAIARGDDAANTELGIVLRRLGDTDGARRAFQAATESGHPDGLAHYGELLLALGDEERAFQAWRQADDLGSRIAAAFLGGQLYVRGRREEAAAALRRAAERGLAGTSEMLGLALQDSDPAGADAAFQRAANEGSANAAWLLGRLRDRQGDLDGALEALAAAARGGSGAAAAQAGRILRDTGDRAGALTVWVTAVAEVDGDELSSLGSALLDIGEEELAGAAFARGDSSGDFESSVRRGLLLYGQGAVGEARQIWRDAAERSDSDQRNRMLYRVRVAGDVSFAEALWNKGARDGDPDAALWLALLDRDRGNRYRYLEFLRLGTANGSAIAAWLLGTELEGEGLVAESEDAFRRGAGLGDSDAGAKLGEILEQAGDTDGAEATYRIFDSAGSVRAAMGLGRILLARGDLHGAEAAFERMRERLPSVAGPAWTLIGQVRERRGDDSGAEDAYRRGDATGSSFSAYNLGRMLEARGASAEAQVAYGRAENGGHTRPEGALGSGPGSAGASEADEAVTAIVLAWEARGERHRDPESVAVLGFAALLRFGDQSIA